MKWKRSSVDYNSMVCRRQCSCWQVVPAGGLVVRQGACRHSGAGCCAGFSEFLRARAAVTGKWCVEMTRSDWWAGPTTIQITASEIRDGCGQEAALGVRRGSSFSCHRVIVPLIIGSSAVEGGGGASRAGTAELDGLGVSCIHSLFTGQDHRPRAGFRRRASGV